MKEIEIEKMFEKKRKCLRREEEKGTRRGRNDDLKGRE